MPPQATAGKGIDSLRVMGPGQVAAYARRGIGRVHINLRAGEELELYLYYEEGRPLRDPEGLVLMRPDQSEEEAGAVVQHAEHWVHFSAEKRPEQWELLFVDFYR